METKEFVKKWRQLVLNQQYSETNVERLKNEVKKIAKISLDLMQDKPDDIELPEIAIISDFALLHLESLEDAIKRISLKVKPYHGKLINNGLEFCKEGLM